MSKTISVGTFPIEQALQLKKDLLKKNNKPYQKCRVRLRARGERTKDFYVKINGEFKKVERRKVATNWCQDLPMRYAEKYAVYLEIMSMPEWDLQRKIDKKNKLERKCNKATLPDWDKKKIRISEIELSDLRDKIDRMRDEIGKEYAELCKRGKEYDLSIMWLHW